MFSMFVRLLFGLDCSRRVYVCRALCHYFQCYTSLMLTTPILKTDDKIQQTAKRGSPSTLHTPHTRYTKNVHDYNAFFMCFTLLWISAAVSACMRVCMCVPHIQFNWVEMDAVVYIQNRINEKKEEEEKEKYENA